MKGRKLSLDEVLKLENGSVIWVDDDEGEYLGVLYVDARYLDLCNDNLCYDLDELEEHGAEWGIKFYEWIEDEARNYNITHKSNSEIIDSMATEICKLRGLDLTDENIEMVIKEFS